MVLEDQVSVSIDFLLRDLIVYSPNGRIPALKDGDLRVFETGAIMQYLVDKYDPQHTISFPFGSADYYECLSWINWQMGGLGPMQGQANRKFPPLVPQTR